MLTRCLLAGACALGMINAANAAAPQTLPIQGLARGQQFEVQTVDLYYLFEVVDPATGQMVGRMSRDGQRYGEPACVYLLGSTPGRQPGGGGISLVRMHEVQVGLSLELGVHTLDAQDRRLTGPVERIAMVPEAGTSP